jgi:uncharacterized protein YndB with AHSA1/START domain
MTSDVDQPYLRIERRFDVPPETAFDTFTIQDQMRVWWGKAVEFDIDLQVGGHWTIVRWEDGTKYLATGTYLEVERPTRLRYTFSMPQFSPDSDMITIRIEDDDQGCSVTFEQTGNGIAKELRELPPGDTSPSEAGWQQGFDLMVAAWSKSAQSEAQEQQEAE